MGYYTAYSLKTDSYYEEPIVEFMKKNTCAIDYALRDDFSCKEAVYWYDWEKDMRKVSKKFPDVHFILSGEGETNSDIWEAHFVAGKMQVCKAEIVIHPFDPKKLE